METKEFRSKLKEAKRILERAKAEYKEVRTNLSNEVLEPYNIHVGSKVIYKRKQYKVHNAIINSKNLTNKFFKDNHIPLKVGDRVMIANGKVGTIVSLYTKSYEHIRYCNYIPMVRVKLDENTGLEYFAVVNNIKKI